MGLVVLVFLIILLTLFLPRLSKSFFKVSVARNFYPITLHESRNDTVAGWDTKGCFSLLCTNMKTVYPALVLLQRLRDLHEASNICLTVICSEDVANIAKPLFDSVEAQIATLPAGGRIVQPPYPVQSASTRKRDQILWNKLFVWSLTKFEKIVMLDVDMLILQPIQELFDLETELAGVPALEPDEKTIFWDPPDPFEADPMEEATWRNFSKPSNIVPEQSGMNGGLMVLRPSEDTYNRLLRAANWIQERTCCPTQEFLYRFFELQGKYQRLLSVYNMRKYHRLPIASRPPLKQVKVYHFVEKQKPWLLGRRVCQSNYFANLWWQHADRADRLLEQRLAGNTVALTVLRRVRHEVINSGAGLQ